jgi:actin-related protein 8
MVIARKATRSEAEDCEPQPKRLKLDDAPMEEWFGEEVCHCPAHRGDHY